MDGLRVAQHRQPKRRIVEVHRRATRHYGVAASGSGANQRWAIAVGTIAESTTTVTSSENWVRLMIPALRP
jgi:hypothetical protein